MGLLTTIRSANVQAEFNDKMAGIVATEFAIITFMVTGFLWWALNWQWIFVGLILTPIVLSFLLMTHRTRYFLVWFIAIFWALPFIVFGAFGVHAAWIGVPVAMLFCFWVHEKAITWSTDVSRSSDNSTSVW